MSQGYNPNFNPTGIEGGIDTHQIPWINWPGAPGMALKPLRASGESGMFSAIVKLSAGAKIPATVHLGPMDLFVLSGALTLPEGPVAATATVGTFGYIPANTQIEAREINQDVEYLGNFYGPVAFLQGDTRSVSSLLTANDMKLAAANKGLTLVPNTLAECMQPRGASHAQTADPVTISPEVLTVPAATSQSPAVTSGQAHFIDTRQVPWLVNEALPDIALKVLRVSEETGITSLVVRHNGVAGPHYHLGAADFLVLSGHIGYRAGPPEGYGKGVWFFEPAGARHEATQQIGEEDLIYTANVYGPVQFDEGPETPIVAVQSWMQYKALADANNVPLVRSTVAGDTTWLAWAPLGST